MNKSNLCKLIKYIKKVFRIEDSLQRLKDDRRNPKYSTAEGILPVLLGFLIRVPSFNGLGNRIKGKEFKKILSRKVKLPGIDVIREVLKRIDLLGLEKLAASVITKAKENKVFKEGNIDGYTVAAIDGELTVAKRLLDKVKQTHKHLVDVVVYDALACNSVWINHCIDNKVIPVIQVKDNNVSSIKQVKSRINKNEVKEQWEDSKRKCEVKAYEQSFQMEVSKRL